MDTTALEPLIQATQPQGGFAQPIGWIALLLYSTGTFIVIRRLFFNPPNPTLSTNSNTILKAFLHSPKAQLLLPGTAAVILHLISSSSALFDASGFNFGALPLLSLISALMIVATLCISLQRPFENITLIVYPVAAVLLLTSNVFGSHYAPRADLSTPILCHIVFSIAAYCILGIAFAQALLLLGQNYQLKHKHLAGMINVLPPLQLMETILFGLIWLGVILLSLSIATGLLYFENFFAQKLVHKTFFTIGAWLMFTTLLIGRYYAGWRGITAIRWMIGGFIFLALGVIGTKIVLEFILTS